ncbi:LacI family DNA-binding transcriptional regulator, partial [Vibrio mimicus]
MIHNRKSLPTLDDVAILAGVSKSVASRALSGKNRPISKDKKQRVIQAAEELGYVANPFAKSLINQETGLIAVVVNHITDLSDLSLFDQLLQAIQSLGKQTLFIRLKEEKDIDEMRKNTFIHRVDAALIFSDMIEPDVAGTLFLTNNILWLNGKCCTEGMSVIIDESYAIQAAVEHAKIQKYEQCYLIGGRQFSLTEQKRICHYQRSIDACGLELKNIVFCNYSYSEAEKFFEKEDARKHFNSVIFCTSDSMAMAAVDFLKKNGYAKSNNVFGFDNTLYSNTYSYQFPTIGYNKNEFIQSILALISPESNYKEQNNKITIEAQFYLN